MGYFSNTKRRFTKYSNTFKKMLSDRKSKMTRRYKRFRSKINRK